MCSFMIEPDQQPSAYIAKKDFKTKDGSVEVKKGDSISVSEYERLFYADQDLFEPSFDDDKPKVK